MKRIPLSSKGNGPANKRDLATLLMVPLLSLLLFVALVPALPAYADEIQSITVDKSHYTLREYVRVTGQVAGYVPAPNKFVLVDVLHSDGGVLRGAGGEGQDPCCLSPLREIRVVPRADGTFTDRFYIPGDALAVKSGRYTVRATYAGKSVEAAIEVTPNHTSATSGQAVLSVQPDKASYTLREYVGVSGRIVNYDPAAKGTVRIDAFDAQGRTLRGAGTEHQDDCCLYMISGLQVTPAADGSYSEKFYIPADASSFSLGQFTLQASYAGRSVEARVAVTAAHASVTDGQSVLSMRSDKASYTVREYVGVSGRIVNYDPAAKGTVRIDAFDAQGRTLRGAGTEHQDDCCLYMISGLQVTPAADGSYSEKFYIPADASSFSLGQFTLQASYAGRSVEARFEVSAAHRSVAGASAPLSVETERPTYLLPDMAADVITTVFEYNYVNITGRVTNYDPARGNTVRIDVFDPAGQVLEASESHHSDSCCLYVISGMRATLDRDGAYRFKVWLPVRAFVPDRVLEIAQGQYTVQVSYEGQSVETSFKVAENPDVALEDLGEAVIKPLLTVRDVFPHRIVPGRSSSVLVQLRNAGTAAGHFVAVTKFVPGVVPSKDIVIPYGDVELLYSDENTLVYAVDIEPFKTTLLQIPLRIDPATVQFDTEPLQPDKLFGLGSRVRLGATFEVATVRPEQWAELAGLYGGVELVQEAFNRSLQNYEAFYNERQALVVQQCGGLADPEPCAVAQSAETRKVSPELANYMESVSSSIEVPPLVVPPADTPRAERDIPETELPPLPSIQACEDKFKVSFIRGEADWCFKICPECFEWPAEFKTSEEGIRELKEDEGHAGVWPSCTKREEDAKAARAAATAAEAEAARARAAADAALGEANAIGASNATRALALALAKIATDAAAAAAKADKAADVAEGKVGKNCAIDPVGAPYGFYNDSRGFCTTGTGKLIGYKSCDEIDGLNKDDALRKGTTGKHCTQRSSGKDNLAWIKTKEDADKQYLTGKDENDLPCFEERLRAQVKVPICQAQFDALISFMFNTGKEFKGSKVKKAKKLVLERLNAGDYDGAAKAIRDYPAANPETTKLLKPRREAEADKFSSCGPGKCTDVRSSMDPNHLYADPEGFIRGDRTVSFTITFENLATATASAEQVSVTATLDESFDLDTFEDIGASHTNGLESFTLDKDARTATWVFTGIDLPPNKNPPEGEGWVRFNLKPLANVATSTRLDAQARIVFDFNPPIDTNVMEHTVDNDPPVTRIRPLRGGRSGTTLEVEWEGSDAVSGLANVAILISGSADGDYAVLDMTEGNKARFVGEPGQTYYFVTAAVDRAGNVESNSGPDTSTTIKEPRSQWWLLILLASIAVVGVAAGSWWFLVHRGRRASTS